MRRLADLRETSSELAEACDHELMGAVVTDEIRVFDRFPVIVIEFVGAPDDAEFEQYLLRLDAISEKQKMMAAKRANSRTAVLIDTTESTRPVTARQRRMQAEYVKRTEGQATAEADAQSAVCFVITNTIIRGVLTAILWLQPMRTRYKVCGTRQEADSWCRRWVLGTGISIPPASQDAG